MAFTVTLNLAETGLTLTLKLLTGSTVNLSQSMPELTVSGVLGRYAATVVSGPPDGTYDAVAVDAAGSVYGSGRIAIKDGAETGVITDVRYVNGVEVDGTGTDNDPWGPV